MTRLIDMAGKRFGRLVVIDRSTEISKDGRVKWRCRCDCGNEVVVIGKLLRSGVTQSCGCLQRERAMASATKHGESKTKLYRVWSVMRDRCYRIASRGYRYYGAKGVRVCGEWKDSFISFKKWALANGYSDGLTLDRIDPHGNYEPSNCRWAGWDIQNNNKRVSNNCKPVEELDGDGIVLAVYESAAEATRQKGGKSATAILNVCKHVKNVKHAYGSCWRFVNAECGEVEVWPVQM